MHFELGQLGLLHGFEDECKKFLRWSLS